MKRSRDDLVYCLCTKCRGLKPIRRGLQEVHAKADAVRTGTHVQEPIREPAPLAEPAPSAGEGESGDSGGSGGGLGGSSPHRSDPYSGGHSDEDRESDRYRYPDENRHDDDGFSLDGGREEDHGMDDDYDEAQSKRQKVNGAEYVRLWSKQPLILGSPPPQWAPQGDNSLASTAVHLASVQIERGLR
jgi:hypothetical protein